MRGGGASKLKARYSKLKKYDFHFFPLLDPFLVEIDPDHAVGLHECEDSAGFAGKGRGVELTVVLYKTHPNVIFASYLRGNVDFENGSSGFFKLGSGLGIFAAEDPDQGRGEKIIDHQGGDRIARKT